MLAFEGALSVAPLARADLALDIGPSTARYLSGFSESLEYPPTTVRFIGGRGTVHVPLQASAGVAVLAIRFARLQETEANVAIQLSGKTVATFVATPAPVSLGEWARRGRPPEGPFQAMQVGRHLITLPAGPLDMTILVRGAGPVEPALAIDWIRVVGAGWRLPLSETSPRVLLLGSMLLLLGSGLGLRRTLAAGVALGSGLAVLAAVDPLALAHASSQLAYPSLALGGLVGLALRRSAGRGWVLLIFLAGYLVKGFALFHPSYYYPDVQSHSRYAHAFADARGSLIARGVAAQQRSGVGYRRHPGGESHVYPYSPVFYVPFSWLGPRRAAVEAGMKHLALACVALEPVVVLVVVRLLTGTGGIFAAVLAATLSPLSRRLLVAGWPALTGHLLDTLLLAAAAWLSARPASHRRLCVVGLLALASQLTYVSSLFTTTAFLLMLALLEPCLRRRLLGVWAACSALTVLLLYGPAVPAFLQGVLPRQIQPPGPGGFGSLVEAVRLAVVRVPLFFGYVLPALTLAGLQVLRRRSRPHAFRVVAAWGLALLLLVGLRIAAHEVFRDLKEAEFAATLVAIASGASLEALAGRRARWSRPLAVALAIALVTSGLADSWTRWRPLASLAEPGSAVPGHVGFVAPEAASTSGGK
jgi:hypothetical protein